MRGHIRKLTVLTFAFVCLVVLSASAYATNVNVYCGGKRLPNTINGALKFLNPQGPNTLTVSGTCKENVVILSFDNLTLQAATGGATINDASGGTADVIKIQDSTRITIRGFTINGSITCIDHSLCRFNGNTIEGGRLRVSRARAVLGGNVIQNFPGTALNIDNASQAYTNGDTIQGNGDIAVLVIRGSFLVATATTVQGNRALGVVIADNSTLNSAGGNLITGNGDTGVLVLRASDGSFSEGDVITANGQGLAEYGGNGVSVWDLSFGRFLPGVNITGNFSGTDVECRGQFPVAEGLENIAPGTTNCVVPSVQARQGAR